MKTVISVAAVAVVAGSASAALVDNKFDPDPSNTSVAIDGVFGAGEYTEYTGGGAGFGGTLGNGVLGMDADSSNLYIGFNPGGDLNDNVVLLLDTRPGGVTDDTTLSDTADPGRNLSSNLVPDVADFYAIGADFSVVIGDFGIVVFELADDGNGQLIFTDFDGTFTGNDSMLAREYSISLATLGLNAGNDTVDFFSAYGSDTNFMSDEAIPAQPFSGGGNLGFDNNGNGDVTWANYNRFNIPTPGTAALLGLAGLAGVRRRRA